jgi:hypothetical protein
MASLIPSANASGTGSMTLAGPSTNSNQTVTIPDTTGTMMVSGNMPAFRAYRNGSQTISASVATKVALNAETFDTNSNFDSTTNYRFTPTVAGYYQVNGEVGFTTGAGQAVLYKNGSTYLTGLEVTYNASLGGHIPISDLVYLNGSTDYIELYVSLTTGTTITSGESNTVFSASMVRSA